MADFPDKNNFRINSPDLYTRLLSTEEARLLYMGAPDYIPEDLTWPHIFSPRQHGKKEIIGKATVWETESGLSAEFKFDDPQLFDRLYSAGITGASIGERPRRKSVEEKIVKWLKEHRRDIVIVTVTALVTAKLAKGGRVVTVEKDGYVFSIPKELFKSL